MSVAKKEAPAGLHATATQRFNLLAASYDRGNQIVQHLGALDYYIRALEEPVTLKLSAADNTLQLPIESDELRSYAIQTLRERRDKLVAQFNLEFTPK